MARFSYIRTVAETSSPGSTPAYGVHLTRTRDDTDAVDRLARLAPRVGLAGLVGDLDRRARRTWAPGLRVRTAYIWDRADNRDRHWWPQGVTHSAGTAEHTGVERDLLLVSWYAKHGQGARVTVLDPAARRYRHVLLVRPVDGGAGVAPVTVHAGGLVWHGPYLHVAATARGFLTFRLADLMRVPDGSRLETHGYRYVLPLAFAHTAGAVEGTERLRYSFLSLDRPAEGEPALVVGEYGRGPQTRRLAAYAVDRATWLPTGADGEAMLPTRLDDGGPRGMQGACWAGDTLVVTTSHGPRVPGSLWWARGREGRLARLRRSRFATPPGPEDICWWPPHEGRPGRLWSVTEHPHQRWVYSMRVPG